METVVRGKTNSVTISSDGPVVIIGESINPTRRKKLANAYWERDYRYVLELAYEQLEAGASVLDVNAGLPGADETSLLPEVVAALAAEIDAPLCLDSANADALVASLEACLSTAPGRPLVNSVNGEASTLKAILPIVKAYGVPVIALTMDETGISMDADKRVAVAGKILERAARLDIPAEDIIIDPLVLTVGADSSAGVCAIQTIEGVRREFGANIVIGASNISFGLPERHTINQAFLALAIDAGATCTITNPVTMTTIIRATELLLGRDQFAGSFIRHYRRQQQKVPKE